MEFYLYRSTSLVESGSDAYDEIFFKARRNNPAADLTGYLHCEDGCFVQYIEGPEIALDQTLKKILRESRHREINVLAKGPSAPRRFGRWDMSMVQREFELFKNWTGNREGISIGNAPVETLMAFFEFYDRSN